MTHYLKLYIIKMMVTFNIIGKQQFERTGHKQINYWTNKATQLIIKIRIKMIKRQKFIFVK